MAFHAPSAEIRRGEWDANMRHTLHKAPVSLDDVIETLARLEAKLNRLLPPSSAPPEWISTQEAKERARVGSEQTIRNWARRHPGLAVMTGGRLRVSVQVLAQVLRSRARQSGA
jgi:hypothetical protein